MFCNQLYQYVMNDFALVHLADSILFWGVVLCWFRWTKLFLLHKTRVAIRFRAKRNLIMHTDYPKFIGMPAVRTDGRRAVGVRSRDYQIFWDG